MSVQQPSAGVRRLLRAAAAFALVSGLLPAGVRPACAQTAADLFNAGTLHEIRLFINSRDLAELRERYTENIFFTADLVWRDIRVRNVAVRSRGSGSRNPIKLGLLVDFDHYTTGQTFVGLKSLVLDNAWQDPSFIREQTAMALFNRMGLPAPRESFCQLFINNVPQGLYVIVENIDTSFLNRVFGGSTGYLFEYHWQFHWEGEELSGGIAAYEPLFEPRTHELDSETTLYSPIRDLFHEINGPADAVWQQRVSQYIDLDQYIRFLATEVFLAEYDGWTGNWGINNLYLYRPATGTQHLVLPWDRDFAMTGQIDSSIFLHLNLSILPMQLLTFSDLKSRYLEMLEKTASMASEDGWFESTVTQSSALITEAVHADTLKQVFEGQTGTCESVASMPRNFDTEVVCLKEFARSRPTYVLHKVEEERGSSATPSRRR
jgi:spore coat protein H